MKPRQLDALVVEKVVAQLFVPRGWWMTPFDVSVPPYSTDIATAMSLLDKFGDAELVKDGCRWFVYLWNSPGTAKDHDGEAEHPTSLPMAICLAALKAKGVKLEEAA